MTRQKINVVNTIASILYNICLLFRLIAHELFLN
jgi:hypothetical protein